MLLQVKNLTKHFAGLLAVESVSLHVRDGEILSIVGPNGAGKSVLFGLISGLLTPTSGQIILQGKEITGLKPHRIARQGIARTFQTTALFDQLRVVDNLAIGYRLRTGRLLVGSLSYPPLARRQGRNHGSGREHSELYRVGRKGLSPCLHPFPGRTEAPVYRGRPDQPTQGDPAGRAHRRPNRGRYR